jgi:hypothetical protein
MDFQETFAPIIKWLTICVIVVMATRNNWTIRHLDVRTTFLKCILHEEVYILAPRVQGEGTKGSNLQVAKRHLWIEGSK